MELDFRRAIGVAEALARQRTDGIDIRRPAGRPEVVINGKAEQRADTIAPITAMSDMLYRVDMTVHEDTFLLSLQGKVADSWSEPRLKHGGVGFFSARGEESRVRWVQLTHQYDMLGRLCAYLAPYNIPTTNGSW